MHLGSLRSQQDTLNQLNAAVDAAFGPRVDEGRTIILGSAAEALWLLSQQSLSGTDQEPDFIPAGREIETP